MTSNADSLFARDNGEYAISPERRRDAHKTAAILRAIEQTADSVFISDRKGVIIYVNPAFEALTGYSAEEAVGGTPALLRSGRHDAAFFQKLWASILGGQVFRFVVTNRTKDGRLYDEDQTITPIRDATGEISHFVTTGRDITQRKRTEEAMRRLHSQLELESARIAGVLHDEAGQFLTSAHITIADIARDLPPAVQARLQEVRHHLDEVAAQLRRVSHELHPSILDDLGLVDAVRFVANAFARRTGIRVSIDAEGFGSCARQTASVVYRFVQEALSNMGKHSRATSATIELACGGPVLRCSIRDNGTGFDRCALGAHGTPRGIGLTLIQDRLEAVGGILEIVTAPGQGTELRATIPLEG